MERGELAAVLVVGTPPPTATRLAQLVRQRRAGDAGADDHDVPHLRATASLQSGGAKGECA